MLGLRGVRVYKLFLSIMHALWTVLDFFNLGITSPLFGPSWAVPYHLAGGTTDYAAAEEHLKERYVQILLRYIAHCCFEAMNRGSSQCATSTANLVVMWSFDTMMPETHNLTQGPSRRISWSCLQDDGFTSSLCHGTKYIVTILVTLIDESVPGKVQLVTKWTMNQRTDRLLVSKCCWMTRVN